MKRITALAFLTAALISMASARANAQAPAFKVSFDFTVGNQVLPAGTYQVSYDATKTAILIRSQDDRFLASTTTYLADPSTSDGEVVFTKYGNQYFLHEVHCSDVSMNVEIPKSKREKQARIQEAQLPPSVTVAALRTGAK
jgi:opacity protein-like surface antigen